MKAAHCKHLNARLWLAAKLYSLALVVPLLSAGCAVFPEGTYWPAVQARAPGGEIPERLKASHESAPALVPEQALARRQALQPNLTRRWSNDGLAASARRMDGGAGRYVYADAMGALVDCYVDPLKYRDLVLAGLESLRAALDNPTFRDRFPEAADDLRRARFAEAVDILALKARAADPWFAFQAADWLAVAMEKNRAMLSLPDGAVVSEMLFGAMDSLDPYTRFLTPQMREAEAREEEYVGIGIQLTSRDGRLLIHRVFEGGSAEKAGLKAGDEIVAVDGQAVAGTDLGAWAVRMRGKAGTKLVLTVRPAAGGEPREVALVRHEVEMPSVLDAQVLDRERGIGYVHLTQFSGGSTSALRQAIKDLERDGMRSLILDLRDNPGGYLLTSVQIAGLFIPTGRVAEIRGRMLGASWKYDVPPFASPAWNGPLAVLVNGHTASAAEVLSAALASHGRATLVGRRTFGKGAAQINVPVDWGVCEICMTIARVYDPDNACLEGQGVTPAVEVRQEPAPGHDLKDDPDVRAAIERLAPDGVRSLTHRAPDPF